jgi:ATP-dependent RNA helicase DeaD
VVGLPFIKHQRTLRPIGTFVPSGVPLLETFTELNLSAPVLRALTELGFTKPSPIQAGALPILLGEPTDFIGLAATGTGKTGAFVIPLLERIDPTQKHVQALIMCPTRELALQVSGQIELLGKYMGIRVQSVYGGTGYGDQISGLKRGAHVVVGTPGRIVDHLDKGTLRLDQLSTVILDEADEMISMGFKEDMTTILSNTPEETRNVWLFSATMDREVRKVADDYLTNPQRIEINRTEMIPELLTQTYFVTSESNKQDILCKLIDAAEDFYGLVFCQTKALCTDLVRILRERNYPADCLHGDMDQNARERTMQSFRDRKVKLLICTDVASRGIDVKDITHVINYSIPRELDNYVHRIGRTARNGKAGFAFSLVTPANRVLIPRIEKMTKSKMIEGKVPTRKEIGEKKLLKVLEKFQTVENIERANSLLAEPWKVAMENMSKEEIASRLLTLQFPEIFSTVKETPAPSMSSRQSENNGRFGGDRWARKSGGGFGGDRRDGRSEGRGRFGGRSEGGGRREGGFGGGSWGNRDRGETSNPPSGAPRFGMRNDSKSERSEQPRARDDRGPSANTSSAGAGFTVQRRSEKPERSFSGFGAKKAKRGYMN